MNNCTFVLFLYKKMKFSRWSIYYIPTLSLCHLAPVTKPLPLTMVLLVTGLSRWVATALTPAGAMLGPTWLARYTRRDFDGLIISPPSSSSSFEFVAERGATADDDETVSLPSCLYALADDDGGGIRFCRIWDGSMMWLWCVEVVVVVVVAFLRPVGWTRGVWWGRGREVDLLWLSVVTTP